MTGAAERESRSPVAGKAPEIRGHEPAFQLAGRDPVVRVGNRGSAPPGANTEPAPLGGDTDPAPLGGDTDPAPLGGDADPAPLAGDAEPAPRSGNFDPAPRAGATPRSAARFGGPMLPGELPLQPWAYRPDARDLPAVDPAAMQALATRTLAAGDGRLAALGIAGPQHGAGATTVARNLAICLAAQFGKRVVLVEANQRSPSLRRLYNLPDSPGLADVLAHRVGVGGALQIAGGHARILILPASRDVGPGDALPSAAGLRGLLAALFGHADAVVVDLAPVIPYRDSLAVCGALDGVALVLRGGASTVAEGKAAVQQIREAGAAVLGAVLNGEKPVGPRFLRKRRSAA